jgi:hypothetical protein
MGAPALAASAAPLWKAAVTVYAHQTVAEDEPRSSQLRGAGRSFARAERECSWRSPPSLCVRSESQPAASCLAGDRRGPGSRRRGWDIGRLRQVRLQPLGGGGPRLREPGIGIRPKRGTSPPPRRRRLGPAPRPVSRDSCWLAISPSGRAGTPARRVGPGSPPRDSVLRMTGIASRAWGALHGSRTGEDLSPTTWALPDLTAGKCPKGARRGAANGAPGAASVDGRLAYARFGRPTG